MEQGDINTRLQRICKKTPIVKRIRTALWHERIHTLELQIEQHKRLLTTAERQLLGIFDGSHPPQDY